MKKVLVLLLTVCVVFGAAAAFAQPENAKDFGNREHRNQQQLHHPNMNFQGQQGEFCKPDGNFERPCRNGHRRMNFSPDMPKEIREKAVELAKLRVDLEEAMSSVPVNKGKALDTYAKMQKLEQEIKMWRFTQRLDRMEKFREEFKKQRELNKEIPPAPMTKDDAKNAPAE